MSVDYGVNFFLRKEIDITSLSQLFKNLLSDFQNLEISAPFDEMISYAYNVDDYRKKYGSKTLCEFTLNELLHFNIRNSYSIQRVRPIHTVLSGIRQINIPIYSEKYFDIPSLFRDKPEIADQMRGILSCIFKELNAYFMFCWHESAFTLDEEKVMNLSNIDRFQAILSKPFPEWTTFIFDNELANSIGRKYLDKWAMIIHPIDNVGLFVSHTKIPFIFTLTNEDIEKGYDRLFLNHIAPKIMERIRSEFKSNDFR